MADQDILHTAEIMKAALPYIDTRNKVMVEFVVKVLELIGLIRTLRKSLSLAACGYDAGKIDMEGMLNNIKPVCNKKERDFIDKILNIFNMKRAMEMYNKMMEVMNAMQDDNGESYDTFDAAVPADSAEYDNDISAYFENLSDVEETSADKNENYEDDGSTDDSSGQNASNDSSGFFNEKMLNMLKSIVPPEQRATFDNLSMLLSSMSYDNTSNADEDKEQEIDG